FLSPGLLGADEIEVVARSEPDVGLLPVGPAAAPQAETLALAGHARRRDALDLDLEQQLDGALDLRLGRVRPDLEHDLAQSVGRHRGLLRYVRAEQNLRQPLLMRARTHPSR